MVKFETPTLTDHNKVAIEKDISTDNVKKTIFEEQ